MKKIIDNIVCDTDTAECLGCMEDYKTSHTYFESLYRTEDGAFFILCEVKFVLERDPEDDTPDEEIFLLSEEDAAEWAVWHMHPDDVTALFGADVYPAQGGEQ